MLCAQFVYATWDSRAMAAGIGITSGAMQYVPLQHQHSSRHQLRYELLCLHRRLGMAQTSMVGRSVLE